MKTKNPLQCRQLHAR